MKHWWLWLAFWVLVLFSGARAQDKAVDQVAARAGTQLESGKPLDAWKSLLELDAADPAAWQRHGTIAGAVWVALEAQLQSAISSRDFRTLLTTTEVLDAAPSRALSKKGTEDFAKRYDEAVRYARGTGHWEEANAHQNARRADQAEAAFQEALRFLRAGDPNFARANLQLAQIFEGRARAMVMRGDSGFKDVGEEALRLYKLARDNPGPDTAAANIAVTKIREIMSSGLPFTVEGIPTPTPRPTPSPTPGYFARVNGEGNAEAIGGFYQRVSSDPSTPGRMLSIGMIVFGVIVLYWALPIIALNRFEARGDLNASDWKRNVRWYGIFALIGYLVSTFRDSRAVRHGAPSKGGKQLCPHCSKPIDNMFAYDDLVFSKCPACKQKIVPLHTLESYIQTLGASMATEAERVNMGTVSLDRYVKDEAVVRLVRALITLGVRRRASDLHIEPDENGLEVRQRIDGIMTRMVTLPRSLSLALVSAVKVTANMNIAEKRVPQDGKMQFRIDNTDIDIRVASSPTGVGEKASMRILDIRSIQMTPQHLGMPPDKQRVFERTIQQPNGMVLMTGPTGSGKTTTIYVAIQAISQGEKNIISIEDPIEFRIPGVNQIQVNPAAGLTFAGGLRSILRQDPDVIVVGEIRDKETAEISVNSVLTGHLVFSTLHTVDAASSIARLMDLGVSPRQFADALSLVVAQRLIRLVCQHCAQPDDPDERILSEIGIHGSTTGFDFKRGAGCQVCNGTGHYRWTGIFEFLQPSERLRAELEAASLSTAQIRDIAVQGGMATLRGEAIALLKSGRTTAEETLRVTK